MLYSLYRKIGLSGLKDTDITLQLADRSITQPMGIVEDVLVKVNKFIFPVDFVVPDMQEDKEVPIILGRPFLATGKIEISVHTGKLTLNVDDERVIFNIFGQDESVCSLHTCFSIGPELLTDQRKR